MPSGPKNLMKKYTLHDASIPSRTSGIFLTQGLLDSLGGVSIGTIGI